MRWALIWLQLKKKLGERICRALCCRALTSLFAPSRDLDLTSVDAERKLADFRKISHFSEKEYSRNGNMTFLKGQFLHVGPQV